MLKRTSRRKPNPVLRQISRFACVQEGREIHRKSLRDLPVVGFVFLTHIHGELVIYKSVDTVVESEEAVNYPTEFLNSLDLPGMPPHVLQLKIGVSIIMLRNINQPQLCLSVKN